MHGTQVHQRGEKGYGSSRLTVCRLMFFAFVSKARSPFRFEGSHESFPECVTKLAGYGVHHSHGEHAAEFPRPYLSL